MQDADINDVSQSVVDAAVAAATRGMYTQTEFDAAVAGSIKECTHRAPEAPCPPAVEPPSCDEGGAGGGGGGCGSGELGYEMVAYHSDPQQPIGHETRAHGSRFTTDAARLTAHASRLTPHA